MNAESFVRYLEDANFLHQISYQELKTMSLQYPYCQNIHLLLLKKGYLENNKDWEKDLTKAAAFSFDRTHLYQQMQAMGQKTAVDNFLLNEEYLELKDLAELEESISLTEEELEESTLAMPAPNEAPASHINIDELSDLFNDSEPTLFVDSQQSPGPGPGSPSSESTFLRKEDQSEITPTPESTSFLSEQQIEALVSYSELLSNLTHSTPKINSAIKTESLNFSQPLLSKLKQRDQQQHVRAHQMLDKLPNVTQRPKPQPKRSFTSWLHDIQEPSMKLLLDEIMEHKKLEEIKKQKKKKKKKNKRMLQEALQSITENDDIASETLAELLVRQGRYNKAIEMYGRLILLFPEKSDYFAARIKHLKSI